MRDFIQKYRFDFLSFVFFTMVGLILFTLQSSMGRSWSYFHPQFWIILCAYCAIYKHPVFSISIIYLISFFYSSASVVHIGQMLLMNAMIFLTALGSRPLNLKNKKAFIIFCTVAAFLYPLMDLFFSAFLALSKNYSYSFWDWVFTVFFTTLGAGVLLPIFLKWDSKILYLKTPKEERQHAFIE